MKELYDRLIEYEKSDGVPCPEGKMKDAQKFAATVCQADETHFLVNGSSEGILSAVYSATKQGGELIMARNCQKSVYDAAEMRELKTHYLYPEVLSEGILGEITIEMVEEAFEKYPDVKTLIFTSPTHDGVVSDVKAIVKAAHTRGVTVIVDESHGAHFLKESGFPKSAIRCGADVVVQSMHKTLPALTQTALLHVNQDYKYKEKIRKYLGMFQTSTPSAVLMSSIDFTMHWYMEEGRETYKKYLADLKKLRIALKAKINHLEILEPENVFDYDISKLLISTRKGNISGEELHKKLLKKYHIHAEMVSANYVLFVTSVTDREEDYRRFLDALLEIDETLEENSMPGKAEEEMSKPKSLMRICEAVEAKKKALPLMESMGETCGVYVYIYPPGIPLLTPGEKISERCVRSLLFYLEEGLKVHGLTKEREIEVVWEEFFT